MKKIIKIIFAFCLFSFAFTGKVLAGDLSIILNEPPSMENTTDFQLFYTAIETDQLPVKVNLYIQKDGDSWRQTIDKDKTDYAGKFQLRGEDFYYGEGKYNFYAHVDSSSGLDSNTVSLTLDTTAPGKVSDYHKERISDTNYRLYFKCPTDTDFEKVYIYRSKDTSFTADAGTRVSEIGCAPGESKTTDIGGDVNVDYYFALRALDHAGNASEVVTDAPGTVIAGQVAGASTGTGTKGKVVLLPEEKGTPTPTEEVKEGELGGGSATEGEVKGESTPKSRLPYVLGGFGILIALGAFFVLRKKQD